MPTMRTLMTSYHLSHQGSEALITKWTQLERMDDIVSGLYAHHVNRQIAENSQQVTSL